APETADYSFRVSNFDFRISDPVLYIIDACPTGPKPITVSNCLAAANRAVANTTEELYCVHLTSGQHVFVIVDDDTAVSNSLGSSFIIEVALCKRETEPNNTMATANPIFCGLEGSISPAGDVDLYSLGVPAVGSRLFAIVDGGAATGPTDFNLRIITTNGTAEYDGEGVPGRGNN